jgi:hypothetical protein
MSWLGRLERVQAEMDERGQDPWQRMLERAIPAGVMSTSTVALLDLIDAPPTTGNARRLAQTMRSMGWVALRSRRLAPGGFRDTTIRGWARPVRESGRRTNPKDGGTVGVTYPATQMHGGTV